MVRLRSQRRCLCNFHACRYQLTRDHRTTSMNPSSIANGAPTVTTEPSPQEIRPQRTKRIPPLPGPLVAFFIGLAWLSDSLAPPYPGNHPLIACYGIYDLLFRMAQAR